MKAYTAKLIRPALAIIMLSIVLATFGMDPSSNPDSNRFLDSKQLRGVYLDTYWRWVPVFGNGNVTLPKNENGNALLAGVAMMPYPNLPDGINGSLDVTFKADQPFFMPLIGIFGTSYSDGVTPPDPFVDAFEEKKLNLKLTLDGKTILDEGKARDHFSQFVFDPPIPYNQSGIDSIIWFEGLGIIQAPLSPGRHVLKLDEKLPVTTFGFTIEYHVTFNVTVLPKTP